MKIINKLRTDFFNDIALNCQEIKDIKNLAFVKGID